ncbi:LAFE_0H03180g1_1 [Lachancea fermentati]|uniref:LAFE_0H03180g1_1 n=1 Tax=Lachancea fermentati TaxID=4955 RepID=A0A1G4MJD0_LACFM|nr:LAFE_0H03180g1_1 [Lachancea fermentati]
MGKKNYKGNGALKGKRSTDSPEKKSSAANSGKTNATATGGKRVGKDTKKDQNSSQVTTPINYAESMSQAERIITETTEITGGHEFVFKEFRKGIPCYRSIDDAKNSPGVANVQLQQLFALDKSKLSLQAARKNPMESQARKYEPSQKQGGNEQTRETSPGLATSTRPSTQATPTSTLESSWSGWFAACSRPGHTLDEDRIAYKSSGSRDNKETAEYSRMVSQKIAKLLKSCGDSIILTNCVQPVWNETPVCCLHASQS